MKLSHDGCAVMSRRRLSTIDKSHKSPEIFSEMTIQQNNTKQKIKYFIIKYNIIFTYTCATIDTFSDIVHMRIIPILLRNFLSNLECVS